MKTLKSVEAANVALDPRHGGIAVATLNEGTVFYSGRLFGCLLRQLSAA